MSVGWRDAPGCGRGGGKITRMSEQDEQYRPAKRASAGRLDMNVLAEALARLGGRARGRADGTGPGRRVLPAQLTDRPGHCPARQRSPGGHKHGLVLDEHPDRAPGVGAPPHALAPPDRDRHRPGHVVQPAHATSAPDGDDSAGRAAHQRPRRGDGHRQRRRAVLDVLDVDTIGPEEQVTPGAGISRGVPTAPGGAAPRTGAVLAAWLLAAGVAPRRADPVACAESFAGRVRGCG